MAYPTDKVYFLGVVRQPNQCWIYRICSQSKYSTKGTGTKYGTWEEAKEELDKRNSTN
jgi:hypothetical protein